jgi:citrate/tricarballylate utilization protein
MALVDRVYRLLEALARRRRHGRQLPAGLLWVKTVTDPAPVARKLMGGEYALLGLLFLIGATGLLLLVMLHTGAMGIMLALHFGLVLSLFVVLPSSKMVHGTYRSIALLRNAREKRPA